MTIKDIVASHEIHSVVDDYRSMCFWNMAEDFYPSNARQLQIVVDDLERYGDMAAYRYAGKIRKWLSQVSSPAS